MNDEATISDCTNLFDRMVRARWLSGYSGAATGFGNLDLTNRGFARMTALADAVSSEDPTVAQATVFANSERIRDILLELTPPDLSLREVRVLHSLLQSWNRHPPA